MVRRPVGIHVSFINDFGEEQELKLFDFQARVFLHELDHLEGKTMINWNISEGNIDVLREHLDENQHFMSTVEFYKEKILSLKKNFKHMFDDHRKFETITDQNDSREWKQFKQDLMADKQKHVEQHPPPTLEETMIVDTIRAMRKDLKQQARNKML